MFGSSFLKRHRFAGGAIVLAGTQFGASLAGFVRDRLLATTFHANLGVVDAYIAAFRPSDLLFQTCIVSALGTVLVPVLASHKAHANDEEVNKILSGTMAVSGLVFGAIALVMALIFPLLSHALVQFPPATLQLYVQFGRLALLTNFLFVFGNALGQYLITVERYWIYGITPILYTLGTIIGTIWLTPYLGAFGPMIGTLGGAIIYVILRLLAVMNAGWRVRWTLWHPDIGHMGKLMIPRILSLGAFQLQLLFLDRLSSGLAEGSVTINSYARNFQSVLVGVVGIAVAQSVYSVMSQAAAKQEAQRFRKIFRYGLWLCLGLTIPGSIVLVFLGNFAAALIGLRSAGQVFTICLLIYAVSIPFESASHLQLRACYAMKNTLLPATFGVLGGAAAVVVAYLGLSSYGLYAIALGYTVGEMVQTIGLAVVLPGLERRSLNASIVPASVI